MALRFLRKTFVLAGWLIGWLVVDPGSESFKLLLLKLGDGLSNLGCGPLTVIVTTRIITFLVGDPNLNLHFPLESCEGATPKSNHYCRGLIWSLVGDCWRQLGG